MHTRDIRVMSRKLLANNKKAVLSQRWPRNVPYTWVHWKFRDSLTTPTATIPNIFMAFCSDPTCECSYKIW